MQATLGMRPSRTGTLVVSPRATIQRALALVATASVVAISLLTWMVFLASVAVTTPMAAPVALPEPLPSVAPARHVDGAEWTRTVAPEAAPPPSS